MNRTSLIPALIVIGLTACQEATTSPALSPEVRAYRYDAAPSYPPPPPSDTGAAGTSSEAGTFSMNVTYMFNKPGNSGFLTFQKLQPEGVSVDPNARVRFSDGLFYGRGEVRIQTAAGLLTVDLANVVEGGKSAFGTCEPPIATGDGASTASQSVSCFNVVIENGKFTSNSGVTTTASEVTLSPCRPFNGMCFRSREQ